MIVRAALLLPVAALSSAPSSAAQRVPVVGQPATVAEHRTQCAGRTGWSDAAPPLRIFANVYDVGTCGIVVLLVTGPRGHILIDGATAGAVPAILANLRRLDIRPRDIRLLLSTHEHHDHAGGLSALRRATGAAMVATAAERPLLESGRPAADDPQKTIVERIASVPVFRTVRDGETVALGPLRLTVHATPGHSPGGTSWSWTSCEGTTRTCRRMVYADSLSAVAADGYRFSDHPAYVARLRATIAKVGRLPCDILMTPHPAASALYDRLYGAKPLVDPAGCSAYAAQASASLDKRLSDERRAG